MQNEWAKNSFLKKTIGGCGRKLELDRFNQWRKLLDNENKRTNCKKGASTILKVHEAYKNGRALDELMKTKSRGLSAKTLLQTATPQAGKDKMNKTKIDAYQLLQYF